MASHSKNNIVKGKKSPKIQHRFLGIREVVCNNASSSNVFSITTTSTGTASTAFALGSQGLTSVQYSGSAWSQATVDVAHLRWLQTTSQTFGYYRITRAKLVFVGNQGTTSSGQINLFGTKDVADLCSSTGLQTAYIQGPYSKTFDLASSGTKEQSLNLPVDSSWKKVSTQLSILGSTSPFVGASTSIINLNTVNDLCFTGIYVQTVGAAASTTVGNLFLDYDVEFSQPMAVGMNL